MTSKNKLEIENWLQTQIDNLMCEYITLCDNE
jgi:hypothetical protein